MCCVMPPASLLMTLVERIVLAVVEALDEGDPLVTLQVGEGVVNVCWAAEQAD